MTDREKLIELLKDSPSLDALDDDGYARGADHLIANGVTAQKHGRWCQARFAPLSAVICSVCNEWFYNLAGSNYCPNCGAKMDLKGETE